MTETELYNLLQTLNVPIAYDHFLTPQNLPFITYRVQDIDPFDADNKTIYYSNNYELSFCTEYRDFTLEASIEQMLFDNDLPFTKAITFIESERFFQTNYYF